MGGGLSTHIQQNVTQPNALREGIESVNATHLNRLNGLLCRNSIPVPSLISCTLLKMIVVKLVLCMHVTINHKTPISTFEKASNSNFISSAEECRMSPP